MLGVVLLSITAVSGAESCIDTEGAVDATLKGALIYTPLGKTEAAFYADSCADEKNLVEYACLEGRPQAQDIPCQYGCAEGRCLQEQQGEDIEALLALSFCKSFTEALPLNAQASSTLGRYRATQAIDGDARTKWFTDPEEKEKMILFDIGEKRCINQASFTIFPLDLPLEGVLEASPDKVTWKKVQDISITQAGKQTLSFDTVYGRYVRLVQEKTARAYGELSEFSLGTAPIPELLLMKLQVNKNGEGIQAPYEVQGKKLQTDATGKAILVVPATTTDTLTVTCPARAGTLFAEETSPPQQTLQTQASDQPFFLQKMLLSILASLKLSITGFFTWEPLDGQTECWNSGAGELHIPGGYQYGTSVSDKIFEFTGEYKGTNLGSNVFDLFIFLTNADVSRGYRFRTANGQSDTPQNALTEGHCSLPGNGWAYCHTEVSEQTTGTSYAPDTYVPFMLKRYYDQIIWKVDGVEMRYELPEWGDQELKVMLGGWEAGGSNEIRNARILCGEEAPPSGPTSCTSFTYSAWSNCTLNRQTRTITSSLPVGCTGGTPLTTRACTTQAAEVDVPVETLLPQVALQEVFDASKVVGDIEKLAQQDTTKKEEEIDAEESCGDYSLFTPRSFTASSIASKSLPRYAGDGDLGTGWYGEVETSFPKSLIVDLETKNCMNRVDLYFDPADIPLTFDIQVSNDKKQWDTVLRNYRATDERTIGLTFPLPVKGRYLRMVQLSSARAFGNVQEIRVNRAPLQARKQFTLTVQDEQANLLSQIPTVLATPSFELIRTRTEAGQATFPRSALNGNKLEVTCPGE